MRKTESNCVGCKSIFGSCMSGCPNKSYTYYECDKCGDVTDELYEYEGEELCFDCLLEKLKKEGKYLGTGICDYCGEEEYVFQYDGEVMCRDCIRKEHKIDHTYDSFEDFGYEPEYDKYA